MRVYLDSNVFISAFKQERGRGVRPLFLEAEEFFERAKTKNATLVLSELFFEEVERHCFISKEETIARLKKTGLKIELAFIQGNIGLKFFLKKTHWSDAVHAAVAVKCKCDAIVTFNIKDFEKIADLVRAIEPREFT